MNIVLCKWGKKIFIQCSIPGILTQCYFLLIKDYACVSIMSSETICFLFNLYTNLVDNIFYLISFMYVGGVYIYVSS